MKTTEVLENWKLGLLVMNSHSRWGMELMSIIGMSQRVKQTTKLPENALDAFI